MFRKRFLFCVAASWYIGCGGASSPTAPVSPDSAATQETYVVRSARPPFGVVPGVSVSVPGLGVVTSDASGTVTVSPGSGEDTLEFSAAGYVSPYRVTRAQLADGIVHLLPDDAGMPWAWLFEGWYASKPDGYLWRPASGVAGVAVSDEMLKDAIVYTALERGVSVINRAQSSVTYVVDDGGAIRMYRDSGDPIFDEPGYENAWAVAWVHISGGTVVGGRIVFKFWSLDENQQHLLPSVVAHELAHLTGLYGHPPGGVMKELAADFSPQEKLALLMAFLRPPGTRPPDDAAGGTIHRSGPAVPGLTSTGASGEFQLCVLVR